MNSVNKIRKKRDKTVVSDIMRKVRASETTPEIRLRKSLWKRGLRFRKNVQNILGKPDIANFSQRIAIFVDGDFWHGRQYKTRGYSSLEDQFKGLHSSKYWIRKIRKNMNRDRLVTQELKKGGWIVIRFWESEVNKDVDKCVDKVMKLKKNICR